MRPDCAGKVWGESRVEYATHLNNLAMLLHEMGRDAEAVALMVKSTDIRRQRWKTNIKWSAKAC